MRVRDRLELHLAFRRATRDELRRRRVLLDELVRSCATLEHVECERHAGPATLAFSDGSQLCLWPAHGPTMSMLHHLAEHGPVVLRKHVVGRRLNALTFAAQGAELSVLGRRLHSAAVAW